MCFRDAAAEQAAPLSKYIAAVSFPGSWDRAAREVFSVSSMGHGGGHRELW